MFVWYIVLTTAFYVSGDVLGKVWATKDQLHYFWIGLLLYAIGGAFSFLAIRQESLSLTLLVMPPIAIIFSLLAGRFLFDEKLAPLQYAAGLVILLAVVVLLWNPKL